MTSRTAENQGPRRDRPSAAPTGTPADAPTGLTIGDLARRTGVSAAVLRTWEARHDFPVPERLESGHRRYAESDVDVVRSVLQHREAGLRLELAIAAARANAEPSSPSVFATLRQRHPEVAVHRLKKSTLLALSWAIEDEFVRPRPAAAALRGLPAASATSPGAEARWTELARRSRATYAFGEFGGTVPAAPGSGILSVDLGPGEPMGSEWAVVCDAVDLPVALTAWELPGQSEVRDRHRLFEALWTVEPRAVRDAARVCARVAQEHGVAEATPLLYELADDPLPGALDARSVTTLFNRVVAYVDRFG